MKIQIKPISVNEAYRGRRFKSKALIQYHHDLANLLPKIEVPKGKLKLKLEFGFSSPRSDADNCVKPFQDVLQNVYGFNDKMIYSLEIVKKDVRKGLEYIDFLITEFE